MPAAGTAHGHVNGRDVVLERVPHGSKTTSVRENAASNNCRSYIGWRAAAPVILSETDVVRQSTLIFAKKELARISFQFLEFISNDLLLRSSSWLS